MTTREEILELVDNCFHAYASSYRNDAREYAIELMDGVESRTCDNCVNYHTSEAITLADGEAFCYADVESTDIGTVLATFGCNKFKMKHGS